MTAARSATGRPLRMQTRSSGAGRPTYVGLAVVVGMRHSILRHVGARDGEQGRSDVERILALILLDLAGGDCSPAPRLAVVRRPARICVVVFTGPVLVACRRMASAAAAAALLRPPLLGRRLLDVPTGTTAGRLGRSDALVTRIGALATKPPAHTAPNAAVRPFPDRLLDIPRVRLRPDRLDSSHLRPPRRPWCSAGQRIRNPPQSAGKKSVNPAGPHEIMGL